MSACCTKRRNDGTLDIEEIRRAIDGQPAKISPDELRIVAMRLAKTRGFGLTRIAQHTGYARSTIAAMLARQRDIKP